MIIIGHKVMCMSPYVLYFVDILKTVQQWQLITL